MQADSIIFDMDGTLVDWSYIIAEAWSEIFEEHHWGKKVSRADFMTYAGHTTAEIGKMAFPETSDKESKERIALASELEVDYIKKNATWKDTFLPNKEFLDKLSKKAKLFIVSNCMANYIETFLDTYGVAAYFSAFLDNRYGVSKAENIIKMVEEHHLKMPIYVGDTTMDYEASKKANVRFVHAEYGYGKFDCSTSIAELNDLLSLVD